MKPPSVDVGSFRFSRPDDVFQLRVSLVDIEPPIWRRVLVPQDVALPQLHRILQAAMGWTDSHLHQFLVGDIRFGKPDEEYTPGPIDYREITLNQIAPRQGSTFTYEYDFGDSWEHLIEVEDVLPAASVKVAMPQCLAGERSCPPEDCGGAPGYERFLAALADPSDDEHEQWRDWAEPDFDAERFDAREVSRALAHLVPRRRASTASRPRRR